MNMDVNMDVEVPYSVPSMAYILQCPTSSMAERITALRRYSHTYTGHMSTYIYSYTHTQTLIHSYTHTLIHSYTHTHTTHTHTTHTHTYTHSLRQHLHNNSNNTIDAYNKKRIKQVGVLKPI
jgi:hypothetical protein